MTTEHWIQIVAAVFTIISSGVVASIVTYRLNAGREERIILRKKLEELFIAVDRFHLLLEVEYFMYIKAGWGEITYEDALESSKQRGVSDDRALERCEVIVSVYFPQLQNELDGILSARDTLSKTLAVLMNSFHQNQDTKPVADKLKAQFEMLDSAETNMKNRIRIHATKLKQ